MLSCKKCNIVVAYCPCCGEKMRWGRTIQPQGYQGYLKKYEDEIVALFDQGSKITDITRHLMKKHGVMPLWYSNSPSTTIGAMVRHILKKHHGRQTNSNETNNQVMLERNLDMYKMRISGATFRMIGEKYNISSSRANQIVNREDRNRRYANKIGE